MKKLFAIVLVFCAIPATVFANTYLYGEWAGLAYESSFDLNADGVNARVFDVHTHNTGLKIESLSGAVDTTIVALPGDPANACQNPASEFELEPLGNVTFKSFHASAVFTEVDSSVHLCFNPAVPDEQLYLTVAGGFGQWAGATGYGIANLHDIVLTLNPQTGYPRLVYTTGDFELFLD